MANNFGRVNVSITASTGGLTAGLAQAGKQLKGFQSSVGGLTGIASALGGMSGMLLPVVGGFTTLAGAIGALTSATRAAEALHNLSQELGVAPGDLQVLQQVAEETGASQEALTTGLRRTARMVGELGQGTPAAVAAFAQLGLTMNDLAGLSTAQQFELIVQRIAELPPQMQAAATVDMFGRSGQGLLTFMRQIAQVTPEVRHLQQVLGVTLSASQVAGIEAMGDAISRLSMPTAGFIKQFLAGVAPAVTAVSNLMLKFFAENTAGWTVAKTLADGFVFSVRMIVGAMNILTGIFQVFQALGSQIGQMFSEIFSVIMTGASRVMRSMASLAEAAGFTGKAQSLREGARGISEIARGAREMGEMYGDAAAQSFQNAVGNVGSPFAAFDAELAAAQQSAQESVVAAAVMPAINAAAAVLSDAISASTKDLKAIVVGSSEGESFRNSIMRGADPRLDVKEESRRTADATEHSADKLDEIASALGPGGGGFALASITV